MNKIHLLKLFIDALKNASKSLCDMSGLSTSELMAVRVQVWKKCGDRWIGEFIYEGRTDCH